MAKGSIDVIDLTQEEIYRKIIALGGDPRLATILVDMHEETRALQTVVNELIGQQKTMIQALTLVNAGFKKHGDQLQRIEKRFGDQNKDLIQAGKPKDDFN